AEGAGTWTPDAGYAYNRASTGDLRLWLGLGTALVCAITGTALLVGRSFEDRSTPPRPALAFSPLSGGGALALSGTF
ncbi:MAG: hypothetical protein WCV84_04415, partial [Patescibacteria group bacterium]